MSRTPVLLARQERLNPQWVDLHSPSTGSAGLRLDGAPFDARIRGLRQLLIDFGRQVLVRFIQVSLVSAYKRNFDKPNQDLSAKIDESTGEVHVFLHRKVTSIQPEEPAEPVEPVEVLESTVGLGAAVEPAEPVYETITVEEAQKIDPNLGEGDSLTVDVTPQQFGRIAAQTAKQVVMQKLREAERKMVYDEFQEREGEIVHGIVQRLEQGNVIVELGRAEAVMPRSEQVPSERYYPGQRLRVYVSRVNETYRGPQIIVSRGHRLMLRRLLEQEVPEIYSGTVEIKAIAREGGARSKVAVVAHQAGICTRWDRAWACAVCVFRT